MKVYFASDHAAFELKNALVSQIELLGYEVEDVGPHSFDPEDDYPDFVIPCAKRVAGEPNSFGIILGGSGQGEAMAANRVPGIRAAVFYGGVLAKREIQAEGTSAHDTFDIVRLPRLHQKANVLSIAARFVSAEESITAIKTFLETAFSDSERHARRIRKFDQGV